MAMKISFLHIVVAVLLLCEVLDANRARTSSSARRSYYRSYRRPARRYSAGNIRRKDCKEEPTPHQTCVKLVKELGYKVCHTNIEQLRVKLERSCPKTCHYCGEPQKSCRTSQYGCCWDAYTPRGDLYGLVGCPECKDHLRLCPRFKKFCKARKSENTAFMELHCPLTCSKCIKKRRVVIKGQRVSMGDWGQL